MNADTNHDFTLGELFAGIGGFGLGFERAGWRSAWQVEIDADNRAVLADRFPGARQFSDVRCVGAEQLSRVRCIAFGSPCQDISIMGHGKSGEPSGLAGSRSGLFHEAMRIVGELRPEWVVFENVPRILTIHDGADIRAIIRAFRERGYLGFGRVLNARHFGVPQSRRRFFLVAGLGRPPPSEFMADAGPMERLPVSLGSGEERPGDLWAAYTLTAPDKGRQCGSRINLASEILVVEPDGWGEMAERARAIESDGLCAGLDEANAAEAWSAGNALCPPIAEWIARILARA